MNYKIQKALFHKYLSFTEHEFVSDQEILDLINIIKNLYNSKKLSNSDIYRQKIELILTSLSKEYELTQRKRTIKQTKLKASDDFCQILHTDLKDYSYKETDLYESIPYEKINDLSINIDNVGSVLQNLVIPKRILSSEELRALKNQIQTLLF